MERLHFISPSLIQPPNPVTVNLIGGGGTGSHMLESLAVINHMLIELGHPGLQVSLWDDDTVTEGNLAKQRFSDSEVGLFKAAALINRTNRTFGTSWKAITRKFTPGRHGRVSEETYAAIYISCVDSVKHRFGIADILNRLVTDDDQNNKPVYWLDTGNSARSGQAWLSTIGEIPQPPSDRYQTVSNLPFLTDAYGEELLQAEDNDDTPSCSALESLEKQDLFINAIIAKQAASLLWSLFRDHLTPYKGFYYNLATFRCEPIPV